VSAAFELHGVRIFACPPEGKPPRTAKDATEIITAAWGYEAKLVVLSANWLGDDFFHLSTRVAGEVVQKLLDYGFRVVIVGDISARVVASEPLRDWVRECNRGRQVWFVRDLEELAGRLAAA
jgi:hypothetical protein